MIPENTMFYTQLTSQQHALLNFVIGAHGDQKRRYNGDPYWYHPFAVAEIIHNANVPRLTEIAFCHDLLEDTALTAVQLKDVLFGLGYSTLDRTFITQGVVALTDVMIAGKYPEMNRKERKHWEAHRLGKIYKDYQTVKYADLIDNTRTILQFDPGFAKVYMAEKRQLIELMRMGNLDLLFDCYALINQYENESKSI